MRKRSFICFLRNNKLLTLLLLLLLLLLTEGDSALESLSGDQFALSYQSVDKPDIRFND